MFKVNPLLCTDGYKVSHHLMYPENTTLVFSNFTPRSVKYMPSHAKEIVVFGIQYTFKYISDLFNANFFGQDKNTVCSELQFHLNSYLGSHYDISHFESLYDLGYLPIEVRALEEGRVIAEKLPVLTIHNTLPEFYWVTNFLETLISTTLWKPMHSASMSYAYNKLVKKYALETDKDNTGFTDFQCHDFSMRGMQSLESAIGSALGFMVCSKGTDTLPVLQAAKYYYNEDSVAFSVPASEHAVMTAYGKEDEIDSFSRILDLFPTGIVSMVSDQFDLWQVLTVFLPQLKDKIMSRDGKAVFRPDSGNPADILCGVGSSYEDISRHFPEGEVLPEYFEDYLLDEVREETEHGERGVDEYTQVYQVRGELYEATIHNISWNRYDKQYYFIEMWEEAKITVNKLEVQPKDKGVIELLWDVFGGTVNEQGYKVLDSHVGAIYGDSITLDRTVEICERLKAKGFASTNVVFGVGSYSMGYATRDNQGSAVKATYVEVGGKGREIYKQPITDDGTKNSAKGLVAVFNGELKDQCTWKEVGSENNELKLLFKNGEFKRLTTLNEIRERING